VLIDWFVVGAQALNFLILVWLMKRFLYKPILRAIAAREERIAAALADADKKRADAQKEKDEFKRKNEKFEQQRAALLSKATDEARTEHQRLLDEAHAAANAVGAKRQQALRDDAHNLNHTLRRRTQQEVFAITRKALTDLAGTSLEERLGEVFIRRLWELDGREKQSFGEALKNAPAPALLRSAFELSGEHRAAIQNALNEMFSSEVRLRFEIAPDLIGGIELSAHGQKVAWSISDYLASLEKGVDELLNEKEKFEAKARTASDLTPKIVKRAYELYEQHGRQSDSAIQDWTQAEREVRKGETKAAEPVPKEKAAEPRPKTETEPKSDTEAANPQPEDKEAEPKPKTEAESEPEDKVAAPEIETELVEPKPKAKTTTESETKTAEPKPETKTAKPEPEAKTAEPEPKAKVEPKPETKRR
jgi:F-type H+-transporting ATPase subunit b